LTKKLERDRKNKEGKHPEKRKEDRTRGISAD